MTAILNSMKVPTKHVPQWGAIDDEPLFADMIPKSKRVGRGLDDDEE